MTANTQSTPASPSVPPEQSAAAGLNQIDQNIETILGFYTSEEQKLTGSQRILEAASEFAGRPLFLGCIMGVVALWIIGNVLLHRLGLAQFDQPPFAWLQGMLSLGALLTTTVVLIRQNRMGKLEERRSHLELQVNLLTEQKVTKLINLLEELRHDLPMVRDRDDPQAAALQQPTDPKQVLDALDARREGGPLLPAEDEKQGND